MIRTMIRRLRAKLAAAQAERATAGLPERLRRDIGAVHAPESRPSLGMIHALDPALLRELRDPEPASLTGPADKPPQSHRRPRADWRCRSFAGHSPHAA
jgi:hypothetical protein